MTTIFSTFLILQLVFLHPGFAQEKVLAEVYGDLDKDKTDEKVLVKELGEKTDMGNIREISIYKKKDKGWRLLSTSKTAVLESDAGGVMGDPFEGIRIENGILTIDHYGGSSWKWSITEKYRFQNNRFELIGYKSHGGRGCDYWMTFDYNVSTGKIIYKKETEKCDESGDELLKTETETETFFRKLKKLPTLDKPRKESKIITPRYKAELYF